MCSRWMISSGASRAITSMASWSPRKSDPLTVSKACDSHVSSGLSAALIPPAAALECERTGWTLLMIATVAPDRAAARAARWPASPAPMIRTSCAGMARENMTHASLGRRQAGLQRPGDLLERDHAAQAAVIVHGHQRAEAPQRLGRGQRLERRVGGDLLAAGRHLADE